MKLKSLTTFQSNVKGKNNTGLVEEYRFACGRTKNRKENPVLPEIRGYVPVPSQPVHVKQFNE